MKIQPNMLTTTFDLHGYSVVQNLGIVQGIAVRSPGLVGNIKASFQSLWSGDVATLTTLCEKTRAAALHILVQHAHELGANAIIGLRFDANELGQYGTEILAYGTAVVVEKI